jgi:quercetin dioxygenase-like cupin family protein
MANKYMIEAGVGEVHWMAKAGARMLHRDGAGTGVALLQHPIKPRGLASPVHTHAKEDEYSFIVAGDVGFQIGDEEFVAGPGAFVSKPRGIAHAFWNAGDTEALVFEVISPAGFEEYFLEVSRALPQDGPPAPDQILQALALAKKYELEMDGASIPVLVSKHGLVM